MSNNRQATPVHVASDHEACLHMLSRLLSVSHRGQAPTQRFVAERLAGLGCLLDEIAFFPRDIRTQYEFAHPSLVDPAPRTAIVGRLAGSDEGRSLLLFAHPDCEPVTDASWHHAPFSGTADHGRLYGVGVADDLVGVAAMICALETISAAGVRPAGTVTLASTPSKQHARGIVPILDAGYRADGALYLHPAESGRGLNDIKAITPGLLRFRITVEGRRAPTQEPEHTPFHHLAVNPIEKAACLINALTDLDRRHAGRHMASAAADGRSFNLQLAHVQAGSAEQLNRGPGTCVLAGSVAFQPDESISDVQAECAAAIRAVADGDPWLQGHVPRIEWLMGIPGARVDLNHPLYRTVHAAIHTLTGQEPQPYALHAASDIRHPILRAGIPCLGIGPLAGDLTQSGHTDEWVDADDYVRFVEVTAQIILDWCGVRGA